MAGWVINVMYAAGYYGLALLMFVENVFPPIPSEVIMPLAGFMASQGKLSLSGIIIAGTIGSALGALPHYYLGRRLGGERLKDFADRHGRWLTLSRRDIERADKWFDKYGGLAVFFCRLVPGLRSLISIPAGMNKMNRATFFLYTILGSAIWTSLLALAGYLLGGSFKQVEEYLDPLTYAVLATFIGWYLWRVVRQKGNPESKAQEG